MKRMNLYTKRSLIALTVTAAVLLGAALFFKIEAMEAGTPAYRIETTYDVFEASNMLLNKNVDSIARNITKEDVKEAAALTSEQMKDTLALAGRLYEEAENDGLIDVIEPYVGTKITDFQPESVYEWLYDYNNDGVKDMLDYNIWNYIQNGYE